MAKPTDSQIDAYLASPEYAAKQAALAEERRRESGFYQGTSTSAKGGPGAPGPVAYTEEGYREAGGYRGNSRTGGAGPGAPAYGSPESIGLPPSNPDAPTLTPAPINPRPTLPIKPGYIPPVFKQPGVPPVTPVVPSVVSVVPPVKPTEIDNSTRDAFAMLTDLFRSYGLEELAGEIADYMKQGFTAGEALIKLKTNPGGAYAARFAGNFTRVKQGLNAISEAEYINLESSYAQTLKAYGLGNMVSSNRKDNYKKFAEYIAEDISAVEFKDRIDLAVTRVQNSDIETRNTLKSFYNINDNDLISYFLNPKENLPKLEQKVNTAEIGGSAIRQNLSTSITSAEDLAKFGISKEQAQVGYGIIAGELPIANKLGNIYSETGITYNQQDAESATFKGLASAKRKKEKLVATEEAQFQGSSGTALGAGSLSTQYLRRSSSTGQY